MKRVLLLIIPALFIFFALSYKPQEPPLHFCIVADRTGVARKGVFEKALTQINGKSPEFTVSVGDLIEGFGDENRTRAQWLEFRGLVSRLNSPFYYVAGNHDIFDKTSEKLWIKLCGPTNLSYYYFTRKNVLFLALDSGSFDKRQCDYFIGIIADSRPKWTFVLMHRPLWKDNDGEFSRLEECFTTNFTIFSGHEHAFSLEKRRGIWYYILATTGGASKLRGPQYGEYDHFMDVEIKDSPIIKNVMVQ